MTIYVLVPGACHGAWCFDDLTAALRSVGRRVLAITLTGVAERAHLAHAGVNLETHITDVLSALSAEPDAENLVLVGHSYGGMVITGVADRIPERVDALVISMRWCPGTVNRVGIWSMTRSGSGTSMSTTPATASPRCRSSTRARVPIRSRRSSSGSG